MVSQWIVKVWKTYFIRFWQWLRSLFSKKSVSVQPKTYWAAIQGTYEKWSHPGAKNLKFYKVILRNNQGQTRLARPRFKTATKALEYAVRFNRLCLRKMVSA